MRLPRLTRASAADVGRAGEAPAPPPAAEAIQVGLIYELLDAHDDTARLACALAGDPAWHVHLEYLRALQRKGRELMAQLALEGDHE